MTEQKEMYIRDNHLQRMFEEQKADSWKNNLTPKDIKEHLDEYVVGQDKAKIALSVAAYEQLQCIEGKKSMKTNLLLVGDTGCGKTYLVKKLSEYLDLPMAIIDSTSLTGAGYRGEDVEHGLERLLQDAGGNISRAEKGIVFIDEFDKLTLSKNYENDYGKMIQSELLKLVEGNKIDLSIHRKSNRDDSRRNTIIDTTNILFIFAGAFADFAQNEKENTIRPFGFKTDGESEVIAPRTSSSQMTKKDVEKYGIMPELMGRISTVVTLDPLDEEKMRKILIDSKDSTIKQYRELFSEQGVTLVVKKDAIEEIAKLAHKEQYGARGLKTILDELFREALFEIPSDHTIVKCMLTKNSVKQGKVNLIRKTSDSDANTKREDIKDCIEWEECPEREECIEWEDYDSKINI